jgi:hypothetical protein
MVDKHIHKLALVSKIFLDKEVLHLRQENELLRLQLFWKDHCSSDLKELMCEANQAPKGPKCKCLSCAVSGRKEDDEESLPWGAACKFKPWFENLLTQCDLTTETGVQIGQEPIGPHMSTGDCNGVYDVDAHFHHLTRSDWFTWTYGARLWKSQSADDQELAKLRALFVLLDNVINDEDE